MNSIISQILKHHYSLGNSNYDDVFTTLIGNLTDQTSMNTVSTDQITYIISLIAKLDLIYYITDVLKFLPIEKPLVLTNDLPVSLDVLTNVILDQTENNSNECFLEIFFMEGREFLKKDSSTLSPASVKSYRSTFKNCLISFGMSNIFHDPSLLISKIYEVEKYKKIQNYVNCFKFVLRNISSKEIAIFFPSNQIFDYTLTILDTASKECKLQLSEQLKTSTQELSPNELATFFPWDTLVDIVTNYRDRILLDIANSSDNVDVLSLRACALTCLYVLENPPRRNELASLCILEGLPPSYSTGKRFGDNWYIDGVVTCTSFKTAEDYGTFTFVVSQKTKIVLDALASRSSYFLFSDIQKQNLPNDTMDLLNDKTSIVKSNFLIVTGKPLTSRLLRVFYISHLTDLGFLKFTSQKLDVASKMGHTIHEQQYMYTRRIEDVPLDLPSLHIIPSIPKRKRDIHFPYSKDQVDTLEKAISTFLPNSPDFAKIVEMARLVDSPFHSLHHFPHHSLRQKAMNTHKSLKNKGLPLLSFASVPIQKSLL